MEKKEKFDVRNQVNNEVVRVVAEAPEAMEATEATEARGKDREVNDRADGQVDEATERSVVQIGTSVVQTETCVEQTVAREDREETVEVVPIADVGVECNGAAEVAEPEGDGCGDSSLAELVERARQEGYESGYSRGYEEAREKSIDEWMQESAGNEVWDYGEESEVMILNNLRPSVWE